MRDKRFTDYEWLLTNSTGGYALGTANLVNRRKYHGLLVASDKNFKRVHAVSSVEEVVTADDDEPFYLDSCGYPDIVHPDGYRRILKYFLRPFPCFIYSRSPHRNDILMTKSMKMHPRLNIVSVRYKNFSGSEIGLALRPKFTLRDHHCVIPPGAWAGIPFETKASGGGGEIEAAGARAYVLASKGEVESDFLIYRNVTYIFEILRGYEGTEDIIAPFRINLVLCPGEEAFLLFSDKKIPGKEINDEIEERYRPLPLPENHPDIIEKEFDIPKEILPEHKKQLEERQYITVLEQAFADFIANDDLVAGYPWFSAWGRDAMISLSALKYLPELKLSGLEKRILFKYGRSMRRGIIPNTTGEGGTGKNYDTADASLWFGIHALEEAKKLDGSEKEKLIRYAENVIKNYIDCPENHFGADPDDGLIALYPDSGLALTWMDARVMGEPVTPRYGKPIEINCLWYNLIRSYVENINSGSLARELREIMEKAVPALKSYFRDGVFADRITEEGEFSLELRPNYIIGLSLPYTVFSAEEITAGYEEAKKYLLTPYGLRTLKPSHPSFRTKYMGNQAMRDLAYHQGTTWVWLLLPMAKTAEKIFGKEKLLHELRRMIFFFRKNFTELEMASVPEIYDGDTPGVPKGAPAQCWSVAAVLTVEKMIKEKGG